MEQIKRGASPKLEAIELPDRYHIRMWGKERYKPLENMLAYGGGIDGGVLSIGCRSVSGLVEAIIRLDFSNYRLKVDVAHGNDDGSAEFIDDMIELSRFFWEFNGNGCLEVWTDDHGCLGRCDAFIPVNVMLNLEGYAEEQAKMTEEATRRREAKTE